MILKDNLFIINNVMIKSILFIWLLLFSTTLIFTILTLSNIHITRFSIMLILLSNILISKYFYTILDKRLYQNNFNGIAISISVLIMFILYGLNYSPILEIRQDPSIYLYKALNIINYGTLDQPLTYLKELIDNNILNNKDYIGYAKILNGTSYNNGLLSLDFFQLPSFFYAFMGLLNKNIIFLTPFVLNTISVILLYFILSNYINQYYSLIFSLLFFITPGILWFGRAPFSEPTALLAIFSILFIFEYIKNKNSQYILLFVLSIFAFFARIDLIILVYIAIFFIAYNNKKLGLLFAILSIYLIYLNGLNSSIYMIRISAVSVIFQYYYIIPIVFLLGVLSSKVFSLEKLTESNVVLVFLFIFFLLLLLFMFRDNFTVVNQMAYIHGREMRTYNETNMEKIFLIIPNFIVVIGMLYLPFLVKNAGFKKDSFIVIIPIFIAFCYYIYNISNSPQMYWSVRRYLYVLLPTFYISYVLFISKQKKLYQNIMLVMTILLILNQNFKSKVVPEMKGLDKSAKNFIHKYPSNKYDLILYDKNLRYIISPIISYGKYQFIPIAKMKKVFEISKFFPNKNILYLTSNNLNNNNRFTIKYSRVGENYLNLPKIVYKKNFSFNVYDVSKKNDAYIGSIKNIDNNTNLKSIFLSEKGFYSGNIWTKGRLELKYSQYKFTNKVFLKITTYGYSNLKRNVVVILNNKKLNFYKKNKNSYYFNVDKNTDNLNTLDINVNTFIPKELGINSDTRTLGLDVKSIFLISE